MTRETLTWVLGFAFVAAFLVGVAAIVLRRAVRARRGDRDTYVRALEALALGDDAQAMSLFRQAVEEDTDNVFAYIHLGRLLRKRGDTDRALRIHRELTIRKLGAGQERRVLREVLSDLMDAGRWEEAKEVALSLKRRGTADVWLLRSLGHIHERLREWDDALSTFEDLEKRRPTQSTRRVALYRAFIAHDFQKRGKIKDARKQYEAALKLEPGLLGALLNLGVIQEQEGEHKRAIETWKELIRRNPNAASLVFERLERATFEKDPSGMTALAAEYERLLAETPTDVSTMRALASLLRRRGDVEDALTILNDAIDLQPENMRLRMERVRMLMETGQRDEAYRELREQFLQHATRGPAVLTCRECGYQSQEYLWRCPSCHCWETFGEA